MRKGCRCRPVVLKAWLWSGIGRRVCARWASCHAAAVVMYTLLPFHQRFILRPCPFRCCFAVRAPHVDDRVSSGIYLSRLPLRLPTVLFLPMLLPSSVPRTLTTLHPQVFICVGCSLRLPTVLFLPMLLPPSVPRTLTTLHHQVFI